MLALAGAQTIWPGNQEVRFRDIRDGTSNTLMVVHANADAAVDWMKPEDINFDPESPFAGLQNARGQVLVVFCDGHARPLSLSLDPEILRALATRAGGEVISHEELDIPANSGRSIRPRSRR